jgi:hypothetical protein
VKSATQLPVLFKAAVTEYLRVVAILYKFCLNRLQLSSEHISHWGLLAVDCGSSAALRIVCRVSYQRAGPSRHIPYSTHSYDAMACLGLRRGTVAARLGQLLLVSCASHSLSDVGKLTSGRDGVAL